MRYGISEEDLDLIVNEIKQHLGNTLSPKLYIYGSRVKGTARKFSDIDLLLIAEKYDESTLKQIDFDELDVPYKVDFVLGKNLYSEYKDEIFFTHEITRFMIV